MLKKKQFVVIVLASLFAVSFFFCEKAKAQNQAITFGRNDDGQIGNGTTSPRVRTPTIPTGLPANVSWSSAGASQSYAVVNGSVWAWGGNGVGEFGNGTTTGSTVPIPVTGVLSSGVQRIVGGNGVGYAIKSGQLYSWGDNQVGQLGTGTSSSTLTLNPVALTGDLASNVAKVSTGNLHTLALRNNAVFSFGNNQFGQLGNGTASGFNSSASPTPTIIPSLSTGVTDIAAGTQHSLALLNGGVYAWGRNDSGQTGQLGSANVLNPTLITTGSNVLTTGVTRISAGDYHNLALKNGLVYSWGRNEFGQLGRGISLIDSSPAQVPGLPTDVVDVATSQYGGSFALTSTGRLFAWGDNSFSLGISQTSPSIFNATEVFAPSGLKWTSISDIGFGHAVFTAAPEPASMLALLAGSWAAVSLYRKKVKQVV